MSNTDGKLIWRTLYIETELPPVFSSEEELEWGKKLKSKNKKVADEARHKFIEHNLRLVMKIARGYPYSGLLDFEDLVSEGNIGLISAVERFDTERGVKFVTYAAYWIKAGIRRALSNDSRIVRHPAGLQIKMRLIKAYMEEKEKERGEKPTKDEVQKKFKISNGLIDILYEYAYSSVSIQRSISESGEGGSNERKLEHILADPAQVPPDVDCERNDEALEIKKHLNRLKEMDSDIVSMRFGLSGDAPMTLEAVGKVVGLTRERIRQRVKDSLAKLKRSMKKNRLDYVKGN
tara:strand:+ start:1468 stop:2340 length:873 start_codon:yes stop_codon:yes gene_type:complete